VFVLTTDHIASAAPELRVVLPDRRDVPARLVGRDVRLDLALLAVDPLGFAPLPLGSSDELQVGEWLVVLGDPFGDEVSAAVGVVSATGRDAAGLLVAGGAPGFRALLQTDARIHRGNSGGPVLDTAGQVVGVAVATSDRPGELSFAIPISRVKDILDGLRDGQVTRSWLGARVQPVDPERAQAAGLSGSTGALITEVRPGSPAATAGLRVGDILLQWAERDADPRSLPWIVAQAPAGRPVHVVLWRDRARVELSVVPQKLPE
jgi:serine protease Do